MRTYLRGNKENCIMQTSRTENVKRNIIGGVINKIIHILLPFITRSVFIYYLGALYLGLNSLFSSILTVLNLTELGVGGAMVFSMYEPIAKKDKETVCALLNIYRRIYRIIGTVMLIIGLCIMPFLKNFIKGEIPQEINIYTIYLIFLSNTVLSYFLYAYKSSILVADQRIDISSYVSSIMSIVISIFQISALILMRNYLFYCLVWPITTIISNLIINYIVNNKYPSYQCHGALSKTTINDIKKRIGGLFIYKLCYVFRDSVGGIIISISLGLIPLAKYNNYFFIITTLTGFFTIIKQSIVSSIGNSIATETTEKNYKDFKTFQLTYMFMAGWVTAVLVCLFQPFIRLWIGEEYLFERNIMFLFCALFFFYKAGDMCAVYRQAAGLWWQDRFRPIVESIINVGLSLLFIRCLGVGGVLIATIFCLICINSIWASWVLYKHYFKEYKQSEYIKNVFFYTIVTFITSAICFVVCESFSINGFIGIGFRTLISCIMATTILVFAYKGLPEFSNSIVIIRQLISKKNH